MVSLCAPTVHHGRKNWHGIQLHGVDLGHGCEGPQAPLPSEMTPTTTTTMTTTPTTTTTTTTTTATVSTYDNDGQW